MAPNRFGSVRMLPSGRWQARYRPASGRHITAPHTFDTRAQAEAWLATLKDEKPSATATATAKTTPPQQIGEAL